MIGTRITKEQESKIKQAVIDGLYMTPSALVKTAIETELKRLYPE